MAAKSGKTVAARIRLLIGAGAAKPAPPVGPALGQAGLNIMSFCKDFNAATAGIKVWRKEGERWKRGGGRAGVFVFTLATPFLRSGRRPHPRHHHRVRGQEL